MKKEDIIIPVSSGELVDKISILKIKRKKIVNKSQLQNINHELSLLNKIRKVDNIALKPKHDISSSLAFKKTGAGSRRQSV